MTSLVSLEKTCNGQGINGDNCCGVNGEACPFLIDNGIPGPGQFRCGLRLKYDSWEAVIRDPLYQPIGEFWESVGQPFHYCMTFDPALCCRKDE